MTSDSTHSTSHSDNEIPWENIIIEQMSMDDLDEVLVIEGQCFSMPWTRQMFETELGEVKVSHPIIIRWIEDPNHPESSKKTICGYCVFWHILDEFHIGNVAVVPEFRRKKIATMMLLHIFQLASEWNIKHISLEVRQSNHGAIHLYELYGFKQIALRKNYYTDPIEDAIVMMKNCEE